MTLYWNILEIYWEETIPVAFEPKQFHCATRQGDWGVEIILPWI